MKKYTALYVVWPEMVFSRLYCHKMYKADAVF